MEDWELIKIDIIDYFGIDFDTRNRYRDIWYLRALYYALCRDITNLTFKEIGGTLDFKFDHATVINGINKFHDTIKFYDKEIREYYDNFNMPYSVVVRDVDLNLGYIKF